MEQIIRKHTTMKKWNWIILPILMIGLLALTQCDKSDGQEEAGCTKNFVTISLLLKHPDGQPFMLDSGKITSPLAEQIDYSWREARIYGSYAIVDDEMQKELENRQVTVHFVGYLNGEIVCEQDVLVGADRCHVHYLGTEPLVQTIYGIPEAVRKQHFCELVTVEGIRDIIPSFVAFVGTIDKTVSHEDRLQMIVDWFLSHDCITSASIDCVLCVPTTQDWANNSRIAFSFVENGQTINMMMLVTGDYANFAGFLSE